MNVLSLFDGMSCGQIALDQLGFKVDSYYAAEIDAHAIKVAKANYPDTIHLGDVRSVMPEALPKIDLLIGGSPCQGFSFAGKQLNFDDPRSKLFFEYVRLLKALKPKYFLLENVKMKKESEQVITDMLGVEPIEINSNLVSAQNRRRLYWTNIPNVTVPEDRGILLADILEQEPVAGHYTAGEHLLKGYKGGNQLNPTYKSQANTIHPIKGKVANLCAGTHGYANGYVPKIMQTGRGWNKGGLKAQDGKTPTLSTSAWEHNNKLTYDEGLTFRKLTPLECERLQTVPEGYTAHVSNTQRYKMLGNGWTVEVIKHIFRNME